MAESHPFQIDDRSLGLIYNNSLDIGSFTQMMKDPTCCYKFYWLEALVNIIDEDRESATYSQMLRSLKLRMLFASMMGLSKRVRNS